MWVVVWDVFILGMVVFIYCYLNFYELVYRGNEKKGLFWREINET